METHLFDYFLPPEAIAQTPSDRRDHSRLLVVNRQNRTIHHHHFHELPDLLPQPADLFRNNAAVIKARLRGERSGGGKVECLLLHPAETPHEWWCLLRPGKRLPVNATFHIGSTPAEVLAKKDDGQAKVRFHTAPGESVLQLADNQGTLPLPPYIERTANDPRSALDEERYQTVYADPRQKVAAAAPTAGLHFTPALNQLLSERGHNFFDLTLHVGLGTFRPIQTDRLEEHQMHREWYEIPPQTATRLNQQNPPLRLAVGTTALRCIEDFHRKAPSPAAYTPDPWLDEAGLFIYPPANFHTQALITNFHLPKSTLLCLVAAFITPGSTDGIDWLRQIYQTALKMNYRFYSYGDAMLIL